MADLILPPKLTNYRSMEQIMSRQNRAIWSCSLAIVWGIFIGLAPSISFGQLRLIPPSPGGGTGTGAPPAANAPLMRTAQSLQGGAIGSPAGAPSTVPPIANPVQTNPPLTTPSTIAVAPVSDVTAITPESIQAYIQQLQGLADIDPVLKQSLVATYDALLVELKNRAENEKFYKELLIAYEAAPAATAEAKKRKENPSPKQVYAEDTLQSSTIEVLQGYQLELQALLQAASDGRSRVEAATVTRDAQKKELPRLVSDTKTAITKINEELNAPPVESADPRLREANLLLLRARLLSLNERNRRLEQEQRTYDAENELLSLQKANYTADEKFYQSKIKEVNEELNKRREILIANKKRLAERLVAQASPELKPRAEQVVKRSEGWLGLAKQSALIRLETEAAKAELKVWTDRYRIMSERIKPDNARQVSSFNSWVGLMLRKQRNELPDIGELNQKLYDYQTKIFSTETLILELDDWKAATTTSSEPGVVAANIVDEFDGASLREQTRMLSGFEHRVVDEYRVDANSYFESLFNLAETTQQTIDQVKRYQAFIDEHVLWIRSSEPFARNDAELVWPALHWLFNVRNWADIPQLMMADFEKRFWLYSIGIGLFVMLLFNQRRFKRETHAQGELASLPNCTTMKPTWKSIAAAILLASPLAVLHIVVGWRLHNTSEGSSFAEAIGMGLMVSARYFFPLELIRQICRAGGLAEKHFGWSTHSTYLLRKNMRWFIDLAIPCVCIVGVVTQFGEAKYENSLGRITYCLLMGLCCLFLLLCMHPKRGVFSDFMSRHAGGWIDRLRYIWYATLCAAPIALIAMSLMGYHYTSVRLAMHMHTTFITLVGLLLISSLIRRWLLLRRREILVSQARQRIEEARRRDPNATSPTVPIVDTHADLAQINAQTMRLVSSTLVFAAIGAVAFIWSAVLPAVGVLDSVRLGWSVEGATPTERIPITLTHLLIAIPTGIMTVVAARNLPGLLEIALLQHLPLENAVRYAIASISRYTILILGIAMTFNAIGVRWSSIQWLVAALGVGLGFGLQEIFANFVSGLILLFEQPVRVGDVITLGETTGTVSRIRMRATTVTNFDQQELIIPNKDLVTGRLLNWTLSDSTNRMIISVGVSYNSNPEQACTILRECCTNHPNVMKEPAPTAFLEQFGDSVLELKARFFLANLDLRLPTKHELQIAIKDRFAAAGIEISFPQRDLHLRTLPAEFVSTVQHAVSRSSLPDSNPKTGREWVEPSLKARDSASSGKEIHTSYSKNERPQVE